MSQSAMDEILDDESLNNGQKAIMENIFFAMKRAMQAGENGDRIGLGDALFETAAHIDLLGEIEARDEILDYLRRINPKLADSYHDDSAPRYCVWDSYSGYD